MAGDKKRCGEELQEIQERGRKMSEELVYSLIAGFVSLILALVVAAYKLYTSSNYQRLKQLRFRWTFGVWPGFRVTSNEKRIVQKVVDVVLKKKAEAFLEVCRAQEQVLEMYPDREVSVVIADRTGAYRGDITKLQRATRRVDRKRSRYYDVWHIAKANGYQVREHAEEYVK